jgi:prepilin-type N-terminal cleavage/methylation domain-containing protein
MSTRPSSREFRGLSLVELLVALAIGSVLIVGAVTVYSNSRSTYAVNESIARLQERGRYVMSVIEPDIELAGYYGYTNLPDTLRLVNGAAPGSVLATAPQLRQRPIPPLPAAAVPAPGLPASAQSLRHEFRRRRAHARAGFERRVRVRAGPRPATAMPLAAVPSTTADTLTLRRASTEPADADRGRSSADLRLAAAQPERRSCCSPTASQPGAVDDDNDIFDLLVRAYYVAADSVENEGLPALRVKALTRVGTNPSFVDYRSHARASRTCRCSSASTPVTTTTTA